MAIDDVLGLPGDELTAPIVPEVSIPAVDLVSPPAGVADLVPDVPDYLSSTGLDGAYGPSPLSPTQALVSAPFNASDVKQTFVTDVGIIVNNKGGLWIFGSDGEWTRLANDDWKHWENRRGDAHVTDDGDIFMASRGRLYTMEKGADGGLEWTELPVGKISGDIAGNDDFLVTFKAGRVLTEMLIIDTETKTVRTVGVDPIPNKAGRADVHVNSDGEILVKNDRKEVFKIDSDTGASERSFVVEKEGYRAASDVSLTQIPVETSLEDALALDGAPSKVKQSFDTDAGIFVNDGYNIHTYTDAEGWTKLRGDGWRKYDGQRGDLQVTDSGEIFVANGRGLYRLDTGFDGKMAWSQVPVGKSSGDVDGHGETIVSFNSGRHLTEMVIVDAETFEVSTVELSEKLGNKAGRADLHVDESGRIFVKDDWQRFDKDGQWKAFYEIDAETGKVQVLKNEDLPDYFTDVQRDVVSTSNGDGVAAAVREQATETGQTGWIDITKGLPGIGEGAKDGVVGMSTMDGDLYATVRNQGTGAEEKSGLYRHDGNGWELVMEADHRYGIGSIVTGEDGTVYVRQGAHLHEVNIETGIWKNISISSSVDVRGMKEAVYDDGKLFMIGSTRYSDVDSKSGRTVSIYDKETGDWTHLPIDHEMDSKPHLDLVIDAGGDIWFKSNYSGIFRAELLDDGSYAEFEKVHDRSGGLFLGADGHMYLSYEVTKYTQKATIFRYEPENPEEQWKMVSEERGYGMKGLAVDGVAGTFVYDKRFGESLMSGTQKFDLPDIEGRNIVTTDGLVFARVGEGQDAKIMALDVKSAVDGVVPYDSDLKVDTSRNLLENMEDEEDVNETSADGLEILSDGTIAAAISVDGQAALKIFDQDGKTELESFELGKVRDMDAAPSGDKLVIGTEDGVLLYDVVTESLTQLTTDPVSGVDVDAAGNIATISGKTVEVMDADGIVLFSKTFNGRDGNSWMSYVQDVAVDFTVGENGNESAMLYVVGFSNQTLPSGLPVQGPHLRAYDLSTGEEVWRRFEFSGREKSGNIADARLYNVEIGEDGGLYVLGESAGTQTIFRYDGTEEGTFENPQDITTKIDHHNDLWNTGSAHVAYHARIDKFTGDVEDAQMTMGRLASSGKSNTYKVDDIAADADGRVFIVGKNAAYLSNRDAISINGTDIPDYDGGDPSFMALSSDFQTRYSWHSFDMGGADGAIDLVATRDGKTVIMGAYKDGEMYTTEGPTNDGGANVFLSVIDTGTIYSPEGVERPLDDEVEGRMSELNDDDFDVGLTLVEDDADIAPAVEPEPVMEVLPYEPGLDPQNDWDAAA